MPNLLKSLPREVLEKEDSKFIYNVLNPLLFDKIKETDTDTTISHKVSSLLHKDINLQGQFLPEFVLPLNINSREFNVYMTDEQENLKLENFGKTELIEELDDIKDYIFFYFGVEGYEFLYDITKKYFYVKNEFEKNKNLYEINYRKYLDEPEVRKKKVYKSTYEHFKLLYDELYAIKVEFDMVYSESFKHTDYSRDQLVDNYAREIGHHLGIKTFDNEIVFEKSVLFEYLNNINFENTVNKHIFTGKNILSTTTLNISNVFELFASFAMELSSIKDKYENYLKLLVDNGNGYALNRSERKMLKNEMHTDISLNLESDNLTYFLNEETKELEIYVYFLRDFRIDEPTFTMTVNDREIPPSIHSLTGNVNYGYSLFEYFDDKTKYYKITIKDYLVYDLDGEHINYDIDNINVTFSAIKSIYHTPKSPDELYLTSTGFLDNFVIYKKNDETGFFEVMHVPYKVKIGIEEQEERYIRSYEFTGIDNAAQFELTSQSEIMIGCYDYDYFYEPKTYVDFFKHINSNINFRYNTILPYVLIDDVMGEDFEIEYYSHIPHNEYSTNIHKNITMYDGKVYKKLFDDVNQMRIINPYNETDYEYVSRVSYSSYLDRPNLSSVLITEMVKKIPFKDNLKYLDKMQYDPDRDMLFFMLEGIQKVVPLNEGLDRGLNHENINYNGNTKQLEYYGVDLCDEDEGFVLANNTVYLKNPLTDVYDEIETVCTESINLSVKEKIIFFDMFEMVHCIIIDGFKYKVDGLYIDTFTNALNVDAVMFVESTYGIPRYKCSTGEIIDVEFCRPVIENETHLNGRIKYDRENNTLIFKCNDDEYYTMNLSKLEIKASKHRQVGMNAFSIFYAGNVLPENSNKTFFGRENMYSSMFIPDDIYNIGRNGDVYNDLQHHELLAEQMDLNVEDAAKYNLEQEPYLMFKSATSSLKGLESYVRSSLKSISDKIGISPVYLVQRNRFVSEWARVSSELPTEYFAEAPLKELVADLMETKLMNENYDDLMDIFKNNEYENFSIDTNNIHNILIQYILRFLDDEALLENFTYYLIHEVWIKNNRKKIIDFIKEHADEKTIREISEMKFVSNHEKEQLFYIFVKELGEIKKQTIDSYIPLRNYSDWNLYLENNHVQFEKPYRYEVIDISDFITMPLEWDQPLYMIRPLTEDDVFVKRDYRFLDISMVTNTHIAHNDAYNEYEEDIKNKLNRNVDYLDETLDVLNEISMSDGFDMMGINLVVVKWIVERFIPTYLSTNTVTSVEEFREIIKNELQSSEHPNMIVSYNRIKETTLLTDLGTNKDEIYESISTGELVVNKSIRLDITSSVELEYLDKIKKPLEHYFDYLFFVERHDIVAKVLALFTEDVIATSMIDLSFAINIKNTKGDETFDVYEKMIYDIFDEFLPFHTVLDKIIFTIKILEGLGAEAVSKELHTDIADTYLVDIVLDFAEKIRIQTLDRIDIFRTHLYIPTEGMTLCGGHDEIPYDYDRKVKVAGHDIPLHMDDYETFAVDDEWYVINRDRWRSRVEDLPTPPQYSEFWWECGSPSGEFEKVAETYLQDYYRIKVDVFERDDRIESHFVDSIPIIDITQGVSEIPDIDVTEDYLIHIDSVYKVKFYDMELLGHDDYGLDEAWGPDDQSTLIDMREGFREHILHDFYEKLSVSLLDSIWTDIVVVYDLVDIPGHDEFGIDEYYHQRSPERLEQELTTMVYDELLTTGFELKHTDMSDISLVDETMAMSVMVDFKEMILDTVVSDDCHITVDIWANRNFDSEGHFLRPAHDEFVYDEYYHDSADGLRADNIGEVLISEYMGDVRIDFGFMRMLPFDPYQQLIDQQFYRANQPGSEFQYTRIKDTIYSNIHTFSKDLIRVGTMDLYELDLIDEDLRRSVYDGIEEETIGGDSFAAGMSDSLVNRHIHHDFRESIIAIDKYAHIVNDVDIPVISTSNTAGQFERDDLFTLELGDTLYSTIKVKHDVERSMTKFDRDYLRSIKIEEENFVEFKYMDDLIEIRFEDILRTYMSFSDRVTLGLSTNDKAFIEQYNKEETSIEILDNVHYGHNYKFEIDGMTVSTSDNLLQVWSNKIHKDSMIVSITDTVDLKTDINIDYNFDERPIQLHDEHGMMGYTDESVERSIESKLTDSLIFTMTDSFSDKASVEIYDGIMTNVSEYYGDFIDVVISDALHTYVEIVKKPWIFPEFDEFGHNEYPHMYNGDSDEFDITTQLRDSVKADAYTSVYEHDALVEMVERIHFGFDYPIEPESVSVSMTDDLKFVGYGTHFSESVDIRINDIHHIEKEFFEQPTNIIVQDRLWYGYKLRDDWTKIQTTDRLIYDYERDFDEDDEIDLVPITIKDWLLIEYTFIDDKPNIQLSDKLTYSGLGTNPKDFAGVALQDTLDIHEFIDLEEFDTARVYISDKLIVDSETGEPTYEKTVDADIILKDTMSVGVADSLFGYGPGKKIKENLSVWTENRLFIDNFPVDDEIQQLAVNLEESYNIHFEIPPFKDSLSIDTYERMKFGPIFKDKTNIVTNELTMVGLKWLDDRYGVDVFPHSSEDMEYYNDSVDRAFEAQVKDDIKILDTHLTFTDGLTILSSDQLGTERPAPETPIGFDKTKTDIMGVSINETLDIRLSWMNDRMGHDGYFVAHDVDGYGVGTNSLPSFGTFSGTPSIPAVDEDFIEVPHDGDQLEYYNDSADRAFDIETMDDIKSIDATLVFRDRLVVTSEDRFAASTSDEPDFDITVESDVVGVAFNENLDVRLLFLDDKHTLEDQAHDEDQMEYYNDSADRAFDVSVYDDVKVVTDIYFGDSLGVMTTDRLVTDDESTVEMTPPADGIIITSNDNLMYGVGQYDYVWDVKEWEKFGYDVPYEDWVGPIPHDELEHDELGHSQQGDDISQISTGVTDNLIFGLDYIFKESLSVSTMDRKISGDMFYKHPDIHEAMGIAVLDTLFIDDFAHYEFASKIMVSGQDRLTSYYEIAPPIDETIDTVSPFKDSISVDTFERFSIVPKFRDKTASVLFGDTYETGVNVEWMDDRYGVDMLPHSEDDFGMEFYGGDGADRAIEARPQDDIKILDTHMVFNESLNILSEDRFASGTSGEVTDMDVDFEGLDTVAIQSNEDIMCDVEIYDYVWDVKQWDNFGYDVPFENWTSPIPYDQLDRGTESLITTGITDTLIVGFDFLFKDVMNIQTSDAEGFEVWGYQSVFKDKTVVYTGNRIKTDWTPIEDDTETVVNFRKERLTIGYEFDDIIKSHKFEIDPGDFSIEEINTYDANTMQLIETIFKYRMYERIDTSINDNMLSSALFKYDEDLSLVTDYKTKIDLYKAEDDGSVTRSMTVIKDKVSENIELLFADGIMAVMKDKLHGTKALRPDEYFD